VKMKTLGFFLSSCVRLALSFLKTGGGSATGNENLWLFLSPCARLALSLHAICIDLLAGVAGKDLCAPHLHTLQ